jgi:hypothetical protein
MTSPAVRNDNRIARVCSAAIREEMGDRLRIELSGVSDPLPQHMTMLVKQMALSDRVSAVLGDKSVGDKSEAGNRSKLVMGLAEQLAMLRLN